MRVMPVFDLVLLEFQSTSIQYCKFFLILQKIEHRV